MTVRNEFIRRITSIREKMRNEYGNEYGLSASRNEIQNLRRRVHDIRLDLQDLTRTQMSANDRFDIGTQLRTISIEIGEIRENNRAPFNRDLARRMREHLNLHPRGVQWADPMTKNQINEMIRIINRNLNNTITQNQKNIFERELLLLYTAISNPNINHNFSNRLNNLKKKLNNKQVKEYAKDFLFKSKNTGINWDNAKTHLYSPDEKEVQYHAHIQNIIVKDF